MHLLARFHTLLLVGPSDSCQLCSTTLPHIKTAIPLPSTVGFGIDCQALRYCWSSFILCPVFEAESEVYLTLEEKFFRIVCVLSRDFSPLVVSPFHVSLSYLICRWEWQNLQHKAVFHLTGLTSWVPVPRRGRSARRGTEILAFIDAIRP